LVVWKRWQRRCQSNQRTFILRRNSLLIGKLLAEPRTESIPHLGQRAVSSLSTHSLISVGAKTARQWKQPQTSLLAICSRLWIHCLWANSRSGSVTGAPPLQADSSATSEMRLTNETSVCIRGRLVPIRSSLASSRLAHSREVVQVCWQAGADWSAV
jgi:hypothetical protein